MRVFIWDKAFELSFADEEDIEYNKFTDEQLKEMRLLLEREHKAVEIDYKKSASQQQNEISEKDSRIIRSFLQLIEADKAIVWPEYRHPELQEEPEELVAYESEVWDFIDALASSEICKFHNDSGPFKRIEILAFLQIPELIDAAGRKTIRDLFASIIYHDCPALSKTRSCGFLGELATKSLLKKFLTEIIKL